MEQIQRNNTLTLNKKSQKEKEKQKYTHDQDIELQKNNGNTNYTKQNIQNVQRMDIHPQYPNRKHKTKNYSLDKLNKLLHNKNQKSIP